MIPKFTNKNCDLIAVIFRIQPHATENDECKNDAVDKKMTSSWRVMSFFFVVFVLPTLLISIPLYARYHLYHAQNFWATDGDIFSLHNTVSSFWCQGQSVTVNGSFEAFQTVEAKRGKLKRKMPLQSTLFLAHDDAEEWGFYLAKGSFLEFSVCARWPGGSLVLVKGKENLQKCFYREFKLEEELRDQELRKQLIIRKFGTESTRNLHQEDQGGEVDDINEQKVSISAGNLPDTLVLTNNILEDQISSRGNKAPETKRANIPLQIISVNETFEVLAGNSSISSSEEFLSGCTNTIASLDLIPYRDCKNRVNLSSKSDINYKFNINESDFYYFIFSSDNTLEANIIYFNLFLLKSTFITSDPISYCSNSTQCTFDFPFASSSGVILDVKGSYSSVSDLSQLQNYEVRSVCKPRFIVYTILIIFVPFIIVLFAFR